MYELKILTAQRVVTAAGTPEQIKETPEHVKSKVIAVEFRAHATNAGDLYVTNADDRASASTVGRIVAAGEIYTIDVSMIPDAYLDLSKIWFDAANNGDGLSYTAIEVV